jgi:GNAT superfamily N-acetyltransferase
MASLAFHPLTPDRWVDFEALALFGPRGAIRGCWCMWWRIKRKEFEANKDAGNKAAMKAIVHSGHVPGLLAYDGRLPVGWVSVAPRADFPVLGRSPILKPVDDKPVWSIVCFFIHRDYKGQGLSHRLLDAAVRHASAHGATIIEGYPIAPKAGEGPDIY